MSTYDSTPTMQEYAVMRLSNWAMRRANRQKSVSNAGNAIRVTAGLNALVRVMLHLAGFGLLTMAGFQWNIIAGMVVAGISCFILSTLMTSSNTENATEVRRAPDMRTGR